MKCSSREILNQIAQVIYDKKGLNILALDVQNLSSIADYLVIAEGNVDRHVLAIARAVTDQLRQRDSSPLYMEGLETGDWVVLDFAGIVVHLFQPGLREKYSLEDLWPQSQIVALDIKVSAHPDF